MEPIRINQSWQEHSRKTITIQSLIRHFEIQRTKKHASFLLLVCIALTILSTLKIIQIYLPVVLILLWVIFGIDLLIRSILHDRAIRKIIKEAKTGFKEEFYFLAFDEEGLTLIASTVENDSKIRWTNLNAYLEEPDTIYLSHDNIYETLSFSEKEIGHESLQSLKKIVKRNLPPFKEYMSLNKDNNIRRAIERRFIS